jgi:hypothetical protein
MQYAAHLPNTRAMVAPVVALVIGAAGATGAYALIDDNAESIQPAAIVVTHTPAAQSGPNEAGVAAVVGTQTPGSSTGKDESATAAAVGNSSVDTSSLIGGQH